MRPLLSNRGLAVVGMGGFKVSVVSGNAGLGGANSGVAREVAEEHDEPGR